MTGATAVTVVILSPHMSLCVNLAWEAHRARVAGENGWGLTLTGQHSLRPHTHGCVRCKLGGGGVSIFNLPGEGRCTKKKMEEVGCYPMKDRRGVCLLRLTFVLPSVVCSIFNVLIDIQKITTEDQRNGTPDTLNTLSSPCWQCFSRCLKSFLWLCLEIVCSLYFLHYSYHNYEDLSRSRVLHTLYYQSTSPYNGRG